MKGKEPSRVRLKQPNRSPVKESAPHWSTTAERRGGDRMRGKRGGKGRGTCGLVDVHHSLNDGLEDGFVAHVVNVLLQRNVDRVIFPRFHTNISTQRPPQTQQQVVRGKEMRRKSDLISPVPGKKSPYLWKDTVMTLEEGDRSMGKVRWEGVEKLTCLLCRMLPRRHHHGGYRYRCRAL
jgi:hypothetical protein